MSELSLEKIKGVGKATIEKLHGAGIYNLEALAVTGGKELATLTGIDQDRTVELCSSARKILQIDIETADIILEKRSRIARITTGSKALDNMLGKGIETQAITELVGEFGSAKTQLCHTLAVTIQLPVEKGGLAPCSVLYVDTEGTFRPERIQSIAEGHGLDPKDILPNIYVATTYSSDHLAIIVDETFRIVPEKNIKLIVVDSIVGRFRPEYVGRECLAERQQKLNRVLSRLLKLAEAYNVAVVITNQVIAQPGVFYGDPNKPAGGHVLAHTSTYRIWLRKGKAGSRVAKIFDSPCHADSEATFKITTNGIEDVPEENEEK